MLENQAFGWLKNAIKGGGGSGSSASGGSADAEAISACTDPAVLVSGVAQDFSFALENNSATDASSSGATAAVDNTDGTSAAVASDGGSSGDDARPSEGETSGESTATSEKKDELSNRLDDLTARLNRIKSLLYEERSASSAAVQQSGAINLNWTPAVATAIFKNFTALLETTGEDATAAASVTTTTDHELFPRLVQNLPLLPFEARKSVSAIFNYLLVCGLDGVDAQQFASVSSAFAAYVLERADMIIGQLVRSHYCPKQSSNNSGASSCVDIALLCGSMLRSSLRHASIYQWILADGNCERLVYPFLDGYVHNPNFDVSSDALETVRVMFTGTPGGSGAAAAAVGITGDPASEEHKQIMEGIASDFLNRKYTDVIDERVNKKCLSAKANYMTRRMTLQLLSSTLR